MRSKTRIRPFAPRDAEAVAALFADYMQETFGHSNAMTPELLLRDGQGKRFRLMLAVDEADQPIGFAAWRDSYDLHNAVSGAEIPDLFVARPFREQALSVRLVARLAREVQQQGGCYIRGEALGDDAKRLRLVRRLTVGFPAETVYLSGRGLRELAGLADADLRTMASKLPTAEASREP